ncbi:MAG TPA: metallophosphoesterase [Chitinophagaceae bacterium]|nr:metallophosphoesterase [Chitinophagaceae bacterium]
MKKNFFPLCISGLTLILISTSCSRSLHQARIVLLPDTQTYAEKYPEVLDSQVSWIARQAGKIDLVLQQGDLTQNNNDKEWQVIKEAFSTLDHKVPYVLAAGNHDMGSADGKFADIRNTAHYNRYFPYSHVAALPGFGGVAEPEKVENAYYTFKTGKKKWLVITLEFGPRNKILDWANEVVGRHPQHVVIINTHSYMYSDSTRQGPGDNWRPQAYGVGKDTGMAAVNDGEQIWEKLVKKHPNIRFVFSGHILNAGVGTLVSINEAGYPVYQMLANYQEGVKGSIKGGNGWLRILDMDFKKKTLQVTTYSPYIQQYKEEPAHRFVIRNILYEAGGQ